MKKLKDQHPVSKGIEAEFVFKCDFVELFEMVFGAFMLQKGFHEHHERGAWNVKIGEQAV